MVADNLFALIGQLHFPSLIIGMGLTALAMLSLLLLVWNRLQRENLLLSLQLEQTGEDARRFEQEAEELRRERRACGSRRKRRSGIISAWRPFFTRPGPLPVSASNSSPKASSSWQRIFTISPARSWPSRGGSCKAACRGTGTSPLTGAQSVGCLSSEGGGCLRAGIPRSPLSEQGGGTSQAVERAAQSGGGGVDPGLAGDQ